VADLAAPTHKRFLHIIAVANEEPRPISLVERWLALMPPLHGIYSGHIVF